MTVMTQLAIAPLALLCSKSAGNSRIVERHFFVIISYNNVDEHMIQDSKRIYSK